MTDGIIQEWLAKHYLEQLTADTVQELIEKIKQEIGNMTIKEKCSVSELHPYDILEKLIGDNSNV